MFSADPRLPGHVRAPELPQAPDAWLNVSRPLSLRGELRGRVVLLDFWTGGCINCRHVLPDLDRLAERFGTQLVIIGVHTGKFAYERTPAGVARAVAQFGIHHPVVNDDTGELWRAYAVRAWPTVVLIDPAGRVIGQRSGEGVYTAFVDLIAETMSAVADNPADPPPPRPTPPTGPLRFPGGLALGGDTLWIADTGHHRVLEVDAGTGRILTTVGSGTPGFQDGPPGEARFRSPHGLLLHNEKLVVADTDNHAVRAIDLTDGTVTTLAGAGVQAVRWDEPGVGAAVALNSPWDLAPLPDGSLVVSMAGFHQLWRLDPSTCAAEPWVGSGREALIDGPRRGGPEHGAALAQPSGLASDGRRIFIADAEGSAVRVFDPVTGEVTTLVGEGLFDFGDADGVGAAVRLQHPLGLAYSDGHVYIADTYNHRIKRLDPTTGAVVTVAGSGEAGFADGPGRAARFIEPGAVAASGRTLFIADTGNGAIRRLDLTTGAVTTLPVHG